MKDVTRTGDAGCTNLADDSRVSKAHLRVEALGAVEELMATLTLAVSLAADPGVQAAVRRIVSELEQVAAEFASPSAEGRVATQWVTALEDSLQEAEAELGFGSKWTWRSEGPAVGALTVARAVCRRAERAAVRLACEAEFGEAAAYVGEAAHESVTLLPYLNRLSDFLQTLARLESRRGLTRQIVARVKAGLAWAGGRGMQPVSADLTLMDCDRMLRAAEQRAMAIGVPMVIAVVDAGGNLKAFKRMDGALLASVDIAQGKAFTAAALRLSTRDAGSLAQPGGALFGLEATNRGRIVTFGGGFPVTLGGEVVGGLGVSGGTVEQDEDVAQAGLAALR